MSGKKVDKSVAVWKKAEKSVAVWKKVEKSNLSYTVKMQFTPENHRAAAGLNTSPWRTGACVTGTGSKIQRRLSKLDDGIKNTLDHIHKGSQVTGITR